MFCSPCWGSGLCRWCHGELGSYHLPRLQHPLQSSLIYRCAEAAYRCRHCTRTCTYGAYTTLNHYINQMDLFYLISSYLNQSWIVFVRPDKINRQQKCSQNQNVRIKVNAFGVIPPVLVEEMCYGIGSQTSWLKHDSTTIIAVLKCKIFRFIWYLYARRLEALEYIDKDMCTYEDVDLIFSCLTLIIFPVVW